MRKIPSTTPRLLALALIAAVGCTDSGPGDASGNPPGNPPGTQTPGQTPPGPGGTKAQSFESDLPKSTSSRSGDPGSFNGEAASDDAAPTVGGAPQNAGTASSGTSKAPSVSAGADAQRAIVEADIIQIAGERLYALSRVAGLTVIDLTDPTHLSILGRYRELNGTPFEMYLRDGVVLAMYSSWGQYTKGKDGNYSYVQTSKVIALDVANPGAISALGSFDVAGEISDSRIVGDVMYVVGYQSGYCWGCTDNKPQTAIISLNVKDPRAVTKVDELDYGDANNNYGWNRRSITVTDKRMYVAGPEYGQSEPTGSTIQVVDISDPAGDLVEGTSVKVAGQVSSRWQMDEYLGVLRVISQVPQWSRQGTAKPAVQTFKVDSSQSLTALGNTALTIPANETLNTVHFDGTRGYAVTSERHDPLFTIDLTDPMNPRQVGQVEIPGWLYHLEPRGNRVIGLGYDQGNPQGAITVSVFDVTDLAAPKLLDRVNFGGDWASLPEDQDRIQKAFRILDDLGLILVPFSGSSETKSGDGYCSYNYRSGIQLVDLKGDDLTARASAPSRGEARRAFIHAQKLLSVSDESVDAFDITDRDHPAAVGKLSIARNVSHALPLANQTVARINEDWYGSQNSTIDFVGVADVDHPERSLSELNLSHLLASNGACDGNTWIEHAFVQGNQVNVTYQRWNYQNDVPGKGGGYSTQVHGVLSIDASDASKPVVLSKLETAETNGSSDSWYQFSNYYQYGYGTAQTSAVRTTTALVFLEQRSSPTVTHANGSTTYTNEVRLRIVDLTDPVHPAQATLALPHSDAYSGLVIDGANIMLSHYETTTAGRAKFYLDRIDLSTPSKPTISGKVNVPGSLLHYDRAHERLLTSELVRTVVPNATATACYARFAFADFDYGNNGGSTVSYPTSGGATKAPSSPTPVDASVVPSDADGGVSVAEPVTPPPPEPTGTCTGYLQRLQLVHFVTDGAVQDDSFALGERDRVSSSSLGDSRVSAVISHGYQGWFGGFGGGPVGIAVDACLGCGGGRYYGSTVETPAELLTLGGFETGHLTIGHLTVSSNLQDPWWGFWGAPPVYASGTRALVQSQSDAVVVDLTDPTKPTIVRKVPLYATPQDLQALGSTVFLALGQQGVQRIDL